mmetsp:Transcript_909/g.1855  ORF Transcript_909/g.1855 Transcript_909/m.1855 type:complete len:223 (+) Transcript_909:131-799(+)
MVNFENSTLLNNSRSSSLFFNDWCFSEDWCCFLSGLHIKDCTRLFGLFLPCTSRNSFHEISHAINVLLLRAAKTTADVFVELPIVSVLSSLCNGLAGLRYRDHDLIRRVEGNDCAGNEAENRKDDSGGKEHHGTVGGNLSKNGNRLCGPIGGCIGIVSCERSHERIHGASSHRLGRISCRRRGNVGGRSFRHRIVIRFHIVGGIRGRIQDVQRTILLPIPRD